MPFTIRFSERSESLGRASHSQQEDWIDTSFAESDRAIGKLRFPGVDNGRYPARHPILNDNGATVGKLADGQTSLGYTFTCVFAGGCFWVTHQNFSSTLHGGGSAVSLIDRHSSFWFSSDVRYDVIESFTFGGHWVSSIAAFKLIDNDRSLLYLTSHGACLFDAVRRRPYKAIDFGERAHQWSDFSLSPKAHILALAVSERGEQDPLDGEYRYTNFVALYDLKTGRLVGEHKLPGRNNTRWAIDFGKDGRQISILSDTEAHTFGLHAG